MKTMKFNLRQALQSVAALGLAALLTACGGGGGTAGTQVLGGGTGGTTTTVADLKVLPDRTSITNTGAESVKLTITSVDSGGAVVGNVPVRFSVDSGGVVSPAANNTDTTTGILTANVGIGDDRTNRKITVTVTSGSIKKTVSFNVVDSVNGGQVADLALVLDRSTLPNDGLQSVKLTLTSLDAQRAAIGGAPVTFKITDVGDAFVSTNGVTRTGDANGQLVATVSLANNKSNRSITVTATSGTVSRSVSFDVVESTVVVPRANDLAISLNKLSVTNSGSDSVEVVATAVDANRNAVAGIDVTFTADSGAVVVVGNSKTAADGTAKATIGIGADRANRPINVTVKSGTLTRQASFRVIGAKLQAQLQQSSLKVGERGQIDYTLLDVNGAPMTKVPVLVTGPGSATSPANAETDAQGKYVYAYTAVGSGPTKITANAGGAPQAESTVQIDAKLSDVPAGTNIASATFTASPGVVSVNAVGSRDNRVELRLLFLSDLNQPVPNVRVRLGLLTNDAGTDGVISSGNDAVITSDANGLAVSSFIAGQRASSTDQVKVYACFGKDDTVESIAACPATRLRLVSLTVVEQPLSISIGTNALIGKGTSNLTYFQEFTVLVVDAAGAPRRDVQLAAVLDLPTYRKGFWTYVRAESKWVQTVTAYCINEDNSPAGYRNGTVETALGVSEDVNGSGQLDPRKSDVSVAMVGSTRTDANGLATLRIEFPQSYGSWVEFSIRVSASGVLSPPAWTGRLAKVGDFILVTGASSLTGIPNVTGVPVDVVKNEGDPPFRISPYGGVGDCSSPN